MITIEVYKSVTVINKSVIIKLWLFGDMMGTT
jgi:hypothetical protein